MKEKAKSKILLAQLKLEICYPQGHASTSSPGELKSQKGINEVAQAHP